MTARTKLVCTLGPASATPKMVQGLVRAGASVFRLNFSHGSPEDHERMVDLVREAETEVGRPLAVLVDLPGPKVRLGQLHVDPLVFKPGRSFVLRPEDRCLQYRAVFHSDNGDRYPVLDRVEIALRR